MRIALDTLGAPETSGGMRLYAEEVLRSWVEAYPDDELLVFGYPWVTALDLPGVEVVEQPEGGARRALGMWVGSGWRARRWRADALVSVSQVVSPLFPRRRRVCVVHDWRHRELTEQFGLAQRLYRRGWDLSIARAGAVAVISEKTRVETSRHLPGTPTVVVENGGDHARRWSTEPVAGVPDGRYLVTHGHFVNKRAELVVAALADPAMPRDVRLVVLGARGEEADRLRARATALGVAERLELPGFVSATAYQALVRGAATAVLASSDEGYGLLVPEAAYLGVPCVVASDGGLPEIHGDRVLVADPDPASMARTIADALDRGRSDGAPVTSWRDTVDGLRRLARTGAA